LSSIMSVGTEVVNGNEEECDVWVDRRSRFGNPFKIEDFTDEFSSKRARRLVVELYAQWFLHKVAADEEFKEAVEELELKKLGCHCKPKDCHADVIATYLDHGAMQVRETYG